MILEKIETIYFNYKIIVFKTKYPKNYPWYFTIEDQDGNIHIFSGISNRCESKRQAFKRAWWRAKWLSDGTFKDRYK